MKGLSLVVMAAGVGSRFGGIKQLEPVGPSGEIILDYSIFDALSAGFSKVVFVIRKELEDDFRDVFGRQVEEVVDTRYVFQELDRLPEGFALTEGRQKPWGTGHAILCCRDEVKEPFVAINADDFYGASGYQSLATFFRRQSSEDTGSYCMAGYELGRTLSDHGHVSRGVCSVSDDGALVNIRELLRVMGRGDSIMHSDSGENWVPVGDDAVASMNMWGFQPDLFEALAAKFVTFLEHRGSDLKAELFIPTVVMELINEGRARVDVVRTDERWVGVTYREDLPVVRETMVRLVSAGIYPPNIPEALALGQLRSKDSR